MSERPKHLPDVSRPAEVFEECFASEKVVFNWKHSSRAESPNTHAYARYLMKSFSVHGTEATIEGLEYVYYCDESRDEVLIEAMFLSMEHHTPVRDTITTVRLILGQPEQPRMRIRSLEELEDAMRSRVAGRGLYDRFYNKVWTEDAAKDAIMVLFMCAQTDEFPMFVWDEHTEATLYDMPSSVLPTNMEGDAAIARRRLEEEGRDRTLRVDPARRE